MDGVAVNAEVNFAAYNDEYSLPVNVVIPEENSFGFFKIPTWANWVSIGKSLVESSNLAYIKILSQPSSE